MSPDHHHRDPKINNYILVTNSKVGRRHQTTVTINLLLNNKRIYYTMSPDHRHRYHHRHRHHRNNNQITNTKDGTTSPYHCHHKPFVKQITYILDYVTRPPSPVPSSSPAP